MDALDNIELQTAKDMFGREIRVGDLCVYPVRRGSSMWMNRITINNIVHDPRGVPGLSGVKGDGYPVKVTSLGRVAIIGRNNTVPFSE